eukprot:scaffold118616_cov78-Phaeocystis_antarctica.AAC.1
MPATPPSSHRTSYPHARSVPSPLVPRRRRPACLPARYAADTAIPRDSSGLPPCAILHLRLQCSAVSGGPHARRAISSLPPVAQPSHSFPAPCSAE